MSSRGWRARSCSPLHPRLRHPESSYLIDRKTGEVAGRQPVKSGPEQILLRDGLLYVRCYDTDDVFRVR